MKIYFSNNKYLSINQLNEEYRRGYKYLNFGFKNSNLTLDSLLDFLNTENILNKIIITDDKNNILLTLENTYNAVYSINRNINESNEIQFNVQLTSGNGNEIPANAIAGEEDKE